MHFVSVRTSQGFVMRRSTVSKVAPKRIAPMPRPGSTSSGGPTGVGLPRGASVAGFFGAVFASAGCFDVVVADVSLVVDGDALRLLQAGTSSRLASSPPSHQPDARRS